MISILRVRSRSSRTLRVGSFRFSTDSVSRVRNQVRQALEPHRKAVEDHAGLARAAATALFTKGEKETTLAVNLWNKLTGKDKVDEWNAVANEHQDAFEQTRQTLEKLRVERRKTSNDLEAARQTITELAKKRDLTASDHAYDASKREERESLKRTLEKMDEELLVCETKLTGVASQAFESAREYFKCHTEWSSNLQQKATIMYWAQLGLNALVWIAGYVRQRQIVHTIKNIPAYNEGVSPAPVAPVRTGETPTTTTVMETAMSVEGESEATAIEPETTTIEPETTTIEPGPELTTATSLSLSTASASNIEEEVFAATTTVPPTTTERLKDGVAQLRLTEGVSRGEAFALTLLIVVVVCMKT